MFVLLCRFKNRQFNVLLLSNLYFDAFVQEEKMANRINGDTFNPISVFCLWFEACVKVGKKVHGVNNNPTFVAFIYESLFSLKLVFGNEM